MCIYLRIYIHVYNGKKKWKKNIIKATRNIYLNNKIILNARNSVQSIFVCLKLIIFVSCFQFFFFFFFSVYTCIEKSSFNLLRYKLERELDFFFIYLFNIHQFVHTLVKNEKQFSFFFIYFLYHYIIFIIFLFYYTLSLISFIVIYSSYFNTQ